MSTGRMLEVPAIEVTQAEGRRIYVFAIDGKEVPRFATVSRVRRSDAAKIEGYQRPEVLAHIEEIRDYIESPAPMIPNAVVIAFDGRVKFKAALPFVKQPGYTRIGTLAIPLVAMEADEDKPGFVVDGQQRLAAIRDANVEHFPVCVSSFVTDDIGQQTEQFILINSTKPLPKALIYELLPGTGAKLPSQLEKRRFPAFLLDRLNRDEDSPLHMRIQTPTTPIGTIKDNSILRMLENSLSDGALYRFHDRKGEADVESMLQLLKNFWRAVAETFPAAWDLPPRKSRLVHGAGIVSLGFVMDAIADRHRRAGVPAVKAFKEGLVPLVEVCRWTDGYWDFGPGQQRKWNELQNTSKDVQLLAAGLLLRIRK